MKVTVFGVLFAMLLTMGASGAAYKEGKTVLDKDYKVDIIRMSWGSKNKDTDRIIGTVRLYITRPEEAYSPITLAFDVFSKNAETNESSSTTAAAKPTGPAAAPQAEKLDTIEFTIDFHKYGYRSMRQYVDGEFCVDVPRNAEANRLALSNVKVSGEAVNYQTTFNISSSLFKTSFTMPEPKVVPKAASAGMH